MTIIESGCHMMWRIKQISDDVIHSTLICIILHIIVSLIQLFLINIL